MHCDVISKPTVALRPKISALVSIEGVVPVAQPRIDQNTFSNQSSISFTTNLLDNTTHIRALDSGKLQRHATPSGIFGIYRVIRMLCCCTGDFLRIPAGTCIDIGVIQSTGLDLDQNFGFGNLRNWPVSSERQFVQSAVTG